MWRKIRSVKPGNYRYTTLRGHPAAWPRGPAQKIDIREPDAAIRRASPDRVVPESTTPRTVAINAPRWPSKLFLDRHQYIQLLIHHT